MICHSSQQKRFFNCVGKGTHAFQPDDATRQEKDPPSPVRTCLADAAYSALKSWHVLACPKELRTPKRGPSLAHFCLATIRFFRQKYGRFAGPRCLPGSASPQVQWKRFHQTTLLIFWNEVKSKSSTPMRPTKLSRRSTGNEEFRRPRHVWCG